MNVQGVLALIKKNPEKYGLKLGQELPTCDQCPYGTTYVQVIQKRDGTYTKITYPDLCKCSKSNKVVPKSLGAGCPYVWMDLGNKTKERSNMPRHSKDG